MPDRRALVFAIIGLLFIGVFIFDIFTPPDDVSICFVYAVLISISVFSYRWSPYACAGLATLLSGLGAFSNPPYETISLAFFANRTIAIAAQWLVAFLVTMHKNSEAMIQAKYEAERGKADASRRFIDVLSHEIGTALTLIDGHAFRLKKLAGDAAQQGLVERSTKIQQAVRHIEEVVRKIQIASEIELGKIPFDPRDFNLAEIVADVVLQFRGERKITTDLAGLPPVICGSADMMLQVVSNLVSNAVKFSAADSEIAIAGRMEGSVAVLSVADRGRGIPRDELPKLFEPYYRASNSRGTPGTGIGLYLVHRYVASHGGEITVGSELGSGTTVTIKIPLRQRLAEESRASGPNSVH